MSDQVVPDEKLMNLPPRPSSNPAPLARRHAERSSAATHAGNRVEGGLLRPRVEQLISGTRDCTKVVDGVLEQIEIVRGAIAGA